MLYPAQPRAKNMGAKTRRILKSNNDSEMIYQYHQSKGINLIRSYRESNFEVPSWGKYDSNLDSIQYSKIISAAQ